MSDESQAAIQDMVQIINSQDATEEEREAALDTIKGFSTELETCLVCGGEWEELCSACNAVE